MRKLLKDLFFDAQDFLQEGDTDLAIRTYQIALENAKKDDAEEFLALTYLAMALDEADDQAKSIEYFNRSQQLAARVFGEKSLEFATALSNEGMIYSNRDRLRMAEPLLDQAASILKSLGKPARSKKAHHVDGREVEVYSNAADCKARLGKMPEAIDLFTRAHQSAKATLPQNHPIRLRAAMDLSVVLEASGQSARAEKFRFEAMDGLMNEDLTPMIAMSLFVEAAANACGLLGSLESAVLPTSSNLSKRNNKAVSNVVPLHSKQTARSKVEAPKESCAAYQLKISLKGIKPPIWRRVVILSSLSLAELHSLIQEAMGWDDSHLHEFHIRNSRFGDRKQMDDVKDERTFDLADFNFKVGSKFNYLYDFGDDWHHVIEVEKLLTKEEFEASDVFVTGKGACPPEDCGGPYGFMHLLDALEHPDARAQLPEWLEEYDPKRLPDCFPVAKKKKSATRSPSASRT
ncbi:MAG: tetratricopeptide repeat protein [Candidatus Obscuribacterales bacterium]|nr:tetratricopeptide repeat protein [Candidatus Obscuribacterales bacterium]